MSDDQGGNRAPRFNKKIPRLEDISLETEYRRRGTVRKGKPLVPPFMKHLTNVVPHSHNSPFKSSLFPISSTKSLKSPSPASALSPKAHAFSLNHFPSSPAYTKPSSANLTTIIAAKKKKANIHNPQSKTHHLSQSDLQAAIQTRLQNPQRSNPARKSLLIPDLVRLCQQHASRPL